VTKEHKTSGSSSVPRLKTHYKEQVVPALMESLGVSNPFEVPRMLKIVINIGVNEAKENIQALDIAKEELGQITGQLPQVRRAKKSISNFKLREGMPIAVRVTLRGDRMYEFMDRLIAIAIPRIRDFRGLEPRGFDSYGNYNLGLQEQHIFPEINMEKSVKSRGMNITFVTSVRQLAHLKDDQRDVVGIEFLERMGMPFRKRTPAAAKTPAAAVLVES
jgi:large subunit ribosomal protein L5